MLRGLRPLVPLLLVAAAGCAADTVEAIDAEVSGIVEKDCRVAYLFRGRRYCRQPEEPEAPPLYCFRTLGGVDCYAEEDPYGVGRSGRARNRPLTDTAKKPGGS